jgi:hypothetical protein
MRANSNGRAGRKPLIGQGISWKNPSEIYSIFQRIFDHKNLFKDAGCWQTCVLSA